MLTKYQKDRSYELINTAKNSGHQNLLICFLFTNQPKMKLESHLSKKYFGYIFVH